MPNFLSKNLLFFCSFFCFLNFFSSFQTYALSPEARLADENREKMAMKLFLQVRCLVCEGQVIESSDTEFSHAMRKLIREKIAEGKTTEKIESELIKEFGEDILVSTNIGGGRGFLLWLLPVIFMLIGGIMLIKNPPFRHR